MRPYPYCPACLHTQAGRLANGPGYLDVSVSTRLDELKQRASGQVRHAVLLYSMPCPALRRGVVTCRMTQMVCSVICYAKHT